MSKIFKINPENPEKDLIREAADIIRAGGLVIFPAKCMYGIGTDALNSKAVKKIFDLKHRAKNKPILVLADYPLEIIQKDSALNSMNSIKNPLTNSADNPADSPADSRHKAKGLSVSRNSIGYLVKNIPSKAKSLMEKFWPGDLTIVFEAMEYLPAALTAKTGKIGIRMPWHPVAKALVMETGLPVTGTSANISGMQGCSSLLDISPELLQDVDMILDAGRLKGGKGSTVIDVTAEPLRILRKGELPEDEIFSCIKETYNIKNPFNIKRPYKK